MSGSSRHSTVELSLNYSKISSGLLFKLAQYLGKNNKYTPSMVRACCLEDNEMVDRIHQKDNTYVHVKILEYKMMARNHSEQH